MLLLDEALERAISTAGITLVPLSVFRYDTVRLQNIFKYALSEFSQWHPKRNHIITNAPSGSVILPEASTVMGVVPWSGVSTSYTRAIHIERLKSDEWRQEGRTLYLPYSGDFRVELLSGYEVDFQNVEYTLTNLTGNEVDISVNLRGDFQPFTFQMEANGLTASDDGNYEINGSLGSGNVSITDSGVFLNFNLTSSVVGPLELKFKSKYWGVESLSIRDTYFLDLFKAELLIGFSHSKQMLRMDGLPVDLDLQELLSMGREIKDRVQESIRTDSSWHLFDGFHSSF